MKSLPLDPFPHVCTNCGRSYSRAEWDALPDLGFRRIPAGDDPVTEPAYVLSYVNCSCHGTMAHQFAVNQEN